MKAETIIRRAGYSARRRSMIMGAHLYAADSCGIYIPQYFAESCVDGWTISEEQKAVLLEGPEHELYWEIWHEVLDNAEFKDKDGDVWRLWQDGDLWAYCDALMDDRQYYVFWGQRRDADDEDVEITVFSDGSWHEGEPVGVMTITANALERLHQGYDPEDLAEGSEVIDSDEF